MTTPAEPTQITHAYVGHDRNGTPMLLAVDDGTRATAHDVADVLFAGGRVERLPIEAARAVRLYEKPMAPGGGR